MPATPQGHERRNARNAARCAKRPRVSSLSCSGGTSSADRGYILRGAQRRLLVAVLVASLALGAGRVTSARCDVPQDPRRCRIQVCRDLREVGACASHRVRLAHVRVLCRLAISQLRHRRSHVRHRIVPLSGIRGQNRIRPGLLGHRDHRRHLAHVLCVAQSYPTSSSPQDRHSLRRR